MAEEAGEDIVRFAMGPDDRARLKCSLPDIDGATS